MSQHFLLALPRARGGASVSPAQLGRAAGLDMTLESPRFVLMTTPGTRCISLGEWGFVVGALFRRHGPARSLSEIDGKDAREIARTRGTKLLADFWGSYLAYIETTDGPLLLRDPSGALPCYLAGCPEFLFAASQVELLLASGHIRTSIDWQALVAHLCGAGLPTSQTVLAGIDELLPGFAWEPGGLAGGQKLLWSPWDHVANAEPMDPAEAAERLRRVVTHSVASLASSCKRVVLSVSGGLDSSIVAASLVASAGPELHCVTMYGNGPAEDERNYARAMCSSLGLPLTERRYRVEDVDIDAPLGAHLPRPFGRSQADAYERAHIEMAHSIGADTFMTGNGGDNVFGYSQSAAAIADRYLCEGVGAGLVRTIRDVCRQTGCSIVDAIAAAARILRAPRSYAWPRSGALLHPDLRTQLEQDVSHPWLVAPPGAMPGKVGHIAGLLRVQPNLEPGRSRYLPVLNPLISQPIMEFCLAIPSWHWRRDGLDRALARTAFRTDLPDMVVSRRGKGGPDGFTALLVAHYRADIRTRLLDGHLAGQGLLDRLAIERLLSNEGPTLGKERTQLLALLATEAWLRFWTDRVKQLRVAWGERFDS